MRNPHGILAGATALVVGVMLVACGAVDQKPATLEVASVPTAEVFIDGAPHGNTPTTVTLPAGAHKIVLQREHFQPHESTIDLVSGAAEKVDAVLLGTDPADAEVIRILAAASEIGVEEFKVPEAHRGAGDSDEMAVLLWPQRDVRLEALSSYAIEVSLEYLGDGYLEFKRGRTVLHREPFEPERVTTVAPIPQAVRDAMKSGSKVTWGIVFDEKRMNVTGKFEVVKGTKAMKALGKLENRRSFRRQPPITQALMRAKVLENHKLYTESLLANLAVVQEFPDSTSPYRGIVDSLRRMDGKGSELWGIASSFVRGKGGNRPGRTSGNAPGSASGPTSVATGGPRPGVTSPGDLGALGDYSPGTVADVMKRLAPGGALGEGTTPAATPSGVGGGTVGPDGNMVPVQPSSALGDMSRHYGELAQHEKHLGENLMEREQQVESLKGDVDRASDEVRAADREAARAKRELDAARAAYEADPKSETDIVKRRAEEKYDDAAERRRAAREHKGDQQGALERATTELEEGQREMENVQQDTAAAREAFESAGGNPAELEAAVGDSAFAGQEPAIALRELQEHFNRSEVALEEARRHVDGLRGSIETIDQRIAANPADTGLVAEREGMLTDLERAEQELQGAEKDTQASIDTFLRALDNVPAGERDPAQAAKLDLLGRQAGTAGEQMRTAGLALEAAGVALASDPANRDLQSALEEAEQKHLDAERAFRKAADAVEEALR